MKKFVLFVCIQLIASISYSQNNDTTCALSIKKSNVSFDSLVGSKKLFYNKYVTPLFGISNETPGNALSIDTKDATLDFKGSIPIGNSALLNLNFKSGVQNGLAAIFTDSKLNRKVGGEISLILGIVNDKRSLFYDNYQIQNDKFNSAVKNSIADSLSAIKIVLECKYNKLISNIKSKNLEMNREKAIIDSITGKHVEEILRIENKIFNDLSKKDSINKAIFDGLKFQEYNLRWFSANLIFQNTAYRLYDKSKAYNEQVFKSDYTNVELRLNWNYLHKSDLAFSYYLQIGVSGFEKDNLTDLDEVNITNREVITNETTTRIVEEKYSAYVGQYKKGLAGISLNLDFYPFIKRDSNNLMHIGFEYSTNEKQVDIQNIIFGLIRGFKTSNSLFNLEFYYKFRDITNNRVSDLTFWQRNEIGLKTSFPLTFNKK